MDTVGVLIMTYGSPDTLEDVEEYLTNIRRGKPPEDEMLQDFKERYKRIGGSPLTEITFEQAETTTSELENRFNDIQFKPYVGMRYFHPYIDEAVREMTEDGIDRAVAMIMSPQYSPVLMKGYLDDLESALGDTENTPEISVVESWWEEPQYHTAVASKINQALDDYPEEICDEVPLLLTAHSIPKSVWEKDPDYVEQLKESADRIGQKINREKWDFAYQSAGHTKEEWLKPDMTDLFPRMAENGYENVLIAPFQFLADHLEILYDIDVAAKKQAEELGLNFKRIESLNTSPPFIESLANVLENKLVEEGVVSADDEVHGE